MPPVVCEWVSALKSFRVWSGFTVLWWNHREKHETMHATLCMSNIERRMRVCAKWLFMKMCKFLAISKNVFVTANEWKKCIWQNITCGYFINSFTFTWDLIRNRSISIAYTCYSTESNKICWNGHLPFDVSISNKNLKVFAIEWHFDIQIKGDLYCKLADDSNGNRCLKIFTNNIHCLFPFIQIENYDCWLSMNPLPQLPTWIIIMLYVTSNG